MKPLILFDFDGVLADSLNIFEKELSTSLKRLGHVFLKGREDFLDLFRENLYVSLSKKGVSGEDLIKVFEYVENNVDFGKIRIFQGVKKAISKILPLIDTAIVSSNKESQIMEILKANRAKDYFPVILGYDAGLGKGAKIKTAMSHFGKDAANTYYITDTVGDLEEVRTSGVRTIAVGWGWHTPDELKSHKPDYFVATDKDLVNFVRGLV